MMGANSWIPTWLGIVATVAFVIVLVVHLWHLVGGTRRTRAWHVGHILMALGMIDMFAPADGMIVSAGVGELVFAVAAVVAAGFVVSQLLRRRRVGWLWPIAAIDLTAMGYMFAMSSLRLGWLTGLLIGWFTLQALGWATGGLTTIADHGGLGEPRTAPATAPPEIATATIGTRTGLAVRAASRRQITAATPQHSPGHSLSIRVTLAIMSLGMAYMFLAMQFGMTHMGTTMPGM